MSWGTELWDQYENLSQHTHKGIEFLERYGQFVRERCVVELEYAGKLRRLVKNYQPKKKDEDDYQYSGCKAFRLLLQELGDLAGQREVVAENLQANVVRELQLLAKELKDERKKQLGCGARLTAALNSGLASLDRAKKAYERAARDAERALDAYQRADADFNLSRAEVEKQRINLTIKSQQCEDAKMEYTSQLQKTNDLQRLHFENALPQVFKSLQDLDEKRIKNIKNFMLSMVEIERNVYPIISKCLDGMVRASHTINEKEDTQLVIDRYKSGFLPPADVPFEELSARGGTGTPQGPHSGSDSADGPHGPVAVAHHTAARGTLSGGKLKKRVGLFAIFGSNKNNVSMENKEEYNALPPNQRRKRLAAKVTDLRKQAAQEQAALDGLMKMKAVYEANPALGDPMTVEGQLNESGHKLEKLHSALAKYTTWLEEAGGNASDSGLTQGGLAPPTSRLNGGHRHSVGSHSDSLSRSASDSSVSTGNAPNNSSHHASASPESGLGMSHNSLPAGAGGGVVEREPPGPSNDSEIGEGGEEDVDGEYYYEPELRPLGTCKALYPFEATSAGSMRMSAGEMLVVVEADQGDGWTRVRRTTGENGGEEGFVPTTYIQVTLFDTH